MESHHYYQKTSNCYKLNKTEIHKCFWKSKVLVVSRANQRVISIPPHNIRTSELAGYVYQSLSCLRIFRVVACDNVPIFQNAGATGRIRGLLSFTLLQHGWLFITSAGFNIWGVESRMPPGITKTSEMCCITYISHCFSDVCWSQYYKRANENTLFNFIVYFTQVKSLIFSMKNTKTSYNKWLKICSKCFIDSIYSTFFNDVICESFFNFIYSNKTRLLRLVEQLNKETVDLWLWYVNHCWNTFT